MNFLAHAYLSFNHPNILTGNMIADFVKGKKKDLYSDEIRAGIELHRKIDAFADAHTATKTAKIFFYNDYRLYAAPIVDVVMDHFLANDQNIFPAQTLEAFAQQVYDDLEKNIFQLPPVFVNVFTYMKHQNWLCGYRSNLGLEKSLKGLMARSSFYITADAAIETVYLHYDDLKKCYDELFEDVKIFAKHQFEMFVH